MSWRLLAIGLARPIATKAQGAVLAATVWAWCAEFGASSMALSRKCRPPTLQIGLSAEAMMRFMTRHIGILANRYPWMH